MWTGKMKEQMQGGKSLLKSEETKATIEVTFRTMVKEEGFQILLCFNSKIKEI